MAWIVGGGVPAAVGAAIEMANACCCTGCAKFSCIRAACNENSDSFALVADNCEQAGTFIINSGNFKGKGELCFLLVTLLMTSSKANVAQFCCRKLSPSFCENLTKLPAGRTVTQQKRGETQHSGGKEALSTSTRTTILNSSAAN